MTPLEAALDGLDAYLGGSVDDAIMLVRAKIRGLLAGYDLRWRAAPYVIDEVEYAVYSDLWNPETERKSRSFTLAGVVDVSGWCGNRRILMDHKTTKEDVSDPAGPYWRQLVVDGQASHYMLMEWLNGRKADDAVWDVIRTPGIRPASVSKKDQEWTLREGKYFGRQLSLEAIEYLKGTGHEDLEMYEARLAHDCSEERSQRYFQRRSVPRMDSEIHQWARELWQHSQDMLYARREDSRPRNAGACLNDYGKACRFLGICAGNDTPDSDKWRKKQQVHSELPILQGDGRDVLTQSRIRCFQTCRQKEYLSYGLGIERAEAEDVDSRYFGSAMHAALAAYFIELKKEQNQNVNNASGSQVSEICTAATEPALP